MRYREHDRVLDAVQGYRLGTKQPFPEHKLSPDLAGLVGQKLRAAWEAGRLRVLELTQDTTKTNVVNNHVIAGFFYDALFNPEKPINVKGLDQDLYEALIEPINGIAKNAIPTREEFVNQFPTAMVEQVPYDKAYYDGAVAEIEKMLKHSRDGFVTIWTTGDVNGLPYLDPAIPGSYEQNARLVRGGWYDKMKSGKHSNLRIIADEDKFNYIDWYSTISEATKRAVRRVVVVDDKLENLEKALERIQGISPELAENTILIWDRQKESISTKDRTRDKALKTTSDSDAIIEIIDIKEAVSAVRKRIGNSFRQESIAWIVDHDEVISDDVKRMQLQIVSVLNWLASIGVFMDTKVQSSMMKSA